MQCFAPKGAGHYSSEQCFIRQLIPLGKRQSVVPAEGTFILELKTFNSSFFLNCLLYRAGCITLKTKKKKQTQRKTSQLAHQFVPLLTRVPLGTGAHGGVRRCFIKALGAPHPGGTSGAEQRAGLPQSHRLPSMPLLLTRWKSLLAMLSLPFPLLKQQDECHEDGVVPVHAAVVLAVLPRE